MTRRGWYEGGWIGWVGWIGWGALCFVCAYAIARADETDPLRLSESTFILLAAGGMLTMAGLGLLVGRVLRRRALRACMEEWVAERTRALHSELQTRRANERQLNNTLRQQRSVLAMVSHEFATPLTIIRMVGHNLGRRHADNLATQEDVVRLGRANDRLMNVVEACLSSEWLDRGSLQLQASVQDLAPMLAEVCEQRRHLTGHRIELVLPAGPIPANIDAALMQMVFDNLLGNAIEYSPPDSPVRIEAQHLPTGALEVSVADQGPGIAASERTRVFERYFRTSNERPPGARSHTGFGLGLHIVRRIVVLHGGNVWVDGDYTAGARFVVRFPAPLMARPVLH